MTEHQGGGWEQGCENSKFDSEELIPIGDSLRRESLPMTEKSSSPLENLPPELRSQVLSWMPDLPTLRAIVHASPILHAQYLEHRNGILAACVSRELNGFYVDAHATLRSRVRHIGRERTDEKVSEFLDSYKARFSGSAPPPSVDSTHPSGVRWLAAYHMSVTRPLALLYSKWALANLKNAAESAVVQDSASEAPRTNEDVEISLSRSEEIRIFRALYRYDTYHHLFGENLGRRIGGFRHHEINGMFCCIFDPWEVEAVGCIDVFVRQKHEDIFEEIKWDLDENNPKFLQPNGLKNPDGSFDLNIEHDDWLNGTIARGLKMTARLLAIDDHEELVAKMERCLTYARQQDDTVKNVLGVIAQSDRREMLSSFPDVRDEAEQRRDPIIFSGDGAPPNTPPLAWVLLWDGKYSNIYGEYVPELLRRWGYVMWDEHRWIDMGAKELVFKQWETASEQIRWIKADREWSPLDGRGTTVTEQVIPGST